MHSAVSGLLWELPGGNVPNLYQIESGMWASAIRVLELKTIKKSSKVNKIDKVELEQNEAACW